MAQYMVISNNLYPWIDITKAKGCVVRVVEAESAIEAVNKVTGGSDNIRAYAVGHVHKHYHCCDGERLGITPFAPVPDFPRLNFFVKVKDHPDLPKIRNYDYILSIHKLYAAYANIKETRRFVVGMAVGGIMECPEVHIEKPIEVIEATTPHEAEDIYNAKYKNYFFYGAVVADIDDKFNLTNIHGNLNLGDIYDAMEKYRHTHQVVPAPTSDEFDAICNGECPSTESTETAIEGAYKTVADDLLKKMKANPDGLVGVSCKVELNDGRVVHIYASEDDDIVCVRKSEVAKLLHDIDTETAADEG